MNRIGLFTKDEIKILELMLLSGGCNDISCSKCPFGQNNLECSLSNYVNAYNLIEGDVTKFSSDEIQTIKNLIEEINFNENL